MELVSVIIPTFNSSALLPRALESVLAQTYSAVEIIAVDDGSTDDTVEVARTTLATARCEWRLIELGENRGPSAARNEGLRIARGAWLQFLDSDDVLAPNKLEHQMAGPASSPDVVALHSPWMMGSIRAKGGQWEGHLCDPDIEGRAPVMCLVPAVRPLLAAALVRRSALEHVGGFDESLRFWECEEACARLAGGGRFVSVPVEQPLYLWQMPTKGDYIGHSAAKYASAEVGLAWIDRILDVTEGRALELLQLSDQDADLLRHECGHWARQLHHADREAFALYMKKVRTLDPDFRPRKPWPLALASRFMSYERAEALAELARGPRRTLERALRRLVPDDGI